MTTSITERVARLIAMTLVIGMPATAITSGLLSSATASTAASASSNSHHLNTHGDHHLNTPDHGTHI